MKRVLLTLVALSVALAGSARAQEAASENKRTVLEEIVARVNNEIITLSALERSRRLLRQELSTKFSGTQLEEEYKKQEADLLRDLIDEALLVQRAA
ncbi:MAG: SurA N-terminal domain-containing protein, partial [Terriglobia bacterium]